STRLTGRRSASTFSRARTTPFSRTAISSGARPVTGAPSLPVTETSTVTVLTGGASAVSSSSARTGTMRPRLPGAPPGYHPNMSENPERAMKRAVVVTVSDSAARGARADLSGPEACRLLRAAGLEVEGPLVVADDRAAIADCLRQAAARAHLVVTTGG